MAEDTRLDAPITAVTVFRQGARITRTGAASLQPGLRSVVVGGLPAAADPASVRVAVRGQNAALLEVEVRRGYGADPLRDETARLRAEVERCRDTIQELDDENAAEQARLSFAGHLSEAAATALARAVGFRRAGHDELTVMADHLSAATASALSHRRDISARRRAASRELEAAEQRLADAERRAGPVAFIDVAAAVEATAEAQAEIEVSYHVAGASWRPLYDLALTGQQLTLGYLAEVTQQTGEDWPEAEVVLSTTSRGQHQELPELRPWYIGHAAPPRPMMKAQLMAAASAAEGAFAAGGPAEPFRAAAPAPAAPLVAEVSESGVSQTYRVPRPLAVPSDGSPHKTTIARLDLDAKLDYLAVPVMAPEAYLRATVSNTSPLLLLPGTARIFRDGQYAGETALQTVATGEEFELQLGVDDRIRIERELRRRSTSKAVIGTTRTVDIAYETTVENHGSAKAAISVRDHIPVSTDGEIKVRLREASPSVSEQTDLGELAWELSLDPGQAATIRYRFTVEHPAQVSVSGL
ncbi:MAG TPA: DUF4139 domain-containing protein [Streptosporangiaceae bacterium]